MTTLRDQLQRTLTGQYTIERELGGGGMSRVFVAEELRLGRRVVVKVLAPDLAASISVERFEREMRLAASLQQANIVPVLSAGETDGLPYYTMPLVDGESLRARLARSAPLPAAEAVRILIDVARALQYAHEHGVVHRDIKPDNVLLSGATAVVTDFGIAKAISAARTESGATLTQVGTSIGTPAYMAPEQAAGDPDIDHRADLYAFGCMAYELLVGEPPFHGRTPQRVLAAHMSEAPKPIAERRPDLPPALSALIMECLSKEPAGRPGNASVLLTRLESVTSGGSLPAMPSVLLHGQTAFWKALALYAVAVVAVGAVVRVSTSVVGLPDWAFPAAMAVMALGLPVILLTGFVQRIAHHAVTATPTITPGGGTAPHGALATLALKASPHVSWKRATTGGFAAFGVLVLVIFAFLGMRAFGVGPAASLFTSGRLKTSDVIIVADFNTSRADSSIGTVAAEAVRASLGESPTIQLASATTIANTLRLMQKPPTARLDFAVARDIAIRQGYKAIVAGDVTGLGNGYVVALKLVTTDSGAVLATYQVTVDGPKELIDGVDAIARKLRAKVGESLKSVQSDPPLARLTTSSIDALRYYTLGNRLNTAGDFSAAIEPLRRAVATDSTFAEGWRKLAVEESNAGLPRSASDSALARAYQLRTKLPQHEALAIAAYYFGSGPGRDRVQAIDLYARLVEDSVAGSIAYINLPMLYEQRREFTKAESILQAGRERGNSLNASHLVGAIHASGRVAAAQALLDSARKRYPTANVLAIPVLELAASESPARLQRVADSIVASGNDDARRLATRAGAQATAALGRARDAKRRILSWARTETSGGVKRDLMRENPWHEVVDPPAVTAALIDGLVRGDSATALHELDSAAAQFSWTSLAPVDRPYTPYALAYAQVHNPAKARALLARMSAEVRDSALLRAWQPMVHQARGEIALDDHQPRVAMDEFRKADSLPDGPATRDPLPLLANLGRAFDQASQPDSAIAYFERYLSTVSVVRAEDDFVYLAGIHRRLGELYEARRDTAKAIAHYNALIQLWKSADPDLQPVVAEMRRRVARLEHETGG